MSGCHTKKIGNADVSGTLWSAHYRDLIRFIECQGTARERRATELKSTSNLALYLHNSQREALYLFQAVPVQQYVNLIFLSGELLF